MTDWGVTSIFLTGFILAKVYLVAQVANYNQISTPLAFKAMMAEHLDGEAMWIPFYFLILCNSTHSTEWYIINLSTYHPELSHTRKAAVILSTRSGHSLLFFFFFCPVLLQQCCFLTGPTNQPGLLGPGRSSCGTSCWSCWAVVRAVPLAGVGSGASLSSGILRGWPGCGGRGRANRTWTTTNSAERSGNAQRHKSSLRSLRPQADALNEDKHPRHDMLYN